MISLTLMRGFRANYPLRGCTKLLPDDEGIATIEYALVAGLIAIAALLGISELGAGVADRWGGVDNEMSKVL